MSCMAEQVLNILKDSKKPLTASKIACQVKVGRAMSPIEKARKVNFLLGHLVLQHKVTSHYANGYTVYALKGDK